MSETETCYSVGFISTDGVFTKIPLYRRYLKASFNEIDIIVNEQQDYLNRSSNDVETEFRFPVKSVSLFRFQYRIDDEEWVEMQVHEKEEAEKTYETAVSMGHQAVLAKQDNDKICTVKIGRLRSNQKVSISFSYYSTYQITSEALCHTFQLTSMPPYIKDGDSTEGLPVWHNSFGGMSNLPYGISLDATFNRSEPFDVNYISNKVQSFQSNGNSVVLPRQTLDGRINVSFQIKPLNGFTSRGSEWTDPEGQKYFQLCFANYFKVKDSHVKDSTDYFNPEVDGDWAIVSDDVDSDGSHSIKDTVVSETSNVIRRVVLIGDGSGSMEGDPIKDLKNAMELAIKDLPRDIKFTLAMFGSTYRFYPDQSVQKTIPQQSFMSKGQMVHTGITCDGCSKYPIVGVRHKCEMCADYDLCQQCFNQNTTSPFHYRGSHTFTTITGQQQQSNEKEMWLDQTDENMKKAMRWLKLNCDSTYGGTEMFSVVNETYDRLMSSRKTDQKYQDMILFMTDGDVQGQDARLCELISRHQQNITFFSMGIGHSHSTALVEKLARAGNGYCSHVFFSEDVPEQVQTVMRCLNTAHVRDGSLEWTDCEVEYTSNKPTKLLFENEPHYVVAKVKSIGNNPRVSLKTNSRGVLKTVIEISLKDLPTSQFQLDQSFAMTRLKEFMNDSTMSKTDKCQKIIPLAIKYNVITPYTASVGVVKSSDPSNTTEMKKINIPIAYPQRGSKQNVYPTQTFLRGGGFTNYQSSCPPPPYSQSTRSVEITMRNNIEKVLERGVKLTDIGQELDDSSSFVGDYYRSRSQDECERGSWGRGNKRNTPNTLGDLLKEASRMDSELLDQNRSINPKSVRSTMYVEQGAHEDYGTPMKSAPMKSAPIGGFKCTPQSSPLKSVGNFFSGIGKLFKGNSQSETPMEQAPTPMKQAPTLMKPSQVNDVPMKPSPTPTSTPSVQPKYTEQQIMENLIKCQNLDGSWTLEQVKKSGLYLSLPSSCGVDEKLLMTVLVVSFFHRILSESSRWITSYKKALKWLNNNDVNKTMVLTQTTFMQLATQLTA
jgi:hypothetical protein